MTAKLSDLYFFSARSLRVLSKYSRIYSSRSKAKKREALENLQSRVNYNRAASAYSRRPPLKMWVLGGN